jgi:hypothetical protein
MRIRSRDRTSTCGVAESPQLVAMLPITFWIGRDGYAAFLLTVHCAPAFPAAPA